MLLSVSTIDKQQKGLDSSAHSSSKAPEDVEDDTEEISMLEDSDVVPSTSAPPTSDAQVTCLFCNCKQKRSGKRLINLTINPSDESLKKIKDEAISLDDHEISSKLENKHIVYHKPCYATFLRNKQQNLEENQASSWHTYRNIHKQALDSLINFISREIIDNNRVMYFSQLFIRYQALLLEFGKDTLDMADIQDYRTEMLERKLLTKLGDKITIEVSTGPRHQKIVYKTDIDVSVMANNTKFLESENEKKFDDVSFHLRNCIKKLDHKPLPKRLRVEDVIRGECEIPKLLFDFMCNLIKGPHFSSEDLNLMTTQITSICSDIIYSVSKGMYKPAKNLL
ncbi:uncharacterized protein LOC103568398 isoform X2 [Microplitis demolitor]|uniref:uncharacterized protein LOC103568398 isoform X2 n=1 Tax=Microplitis demolitor TaxID=69319 RepID=UPI0004CDA180|nr:uncharacterized protein LOC103568398 isoform X2 [Microplitis demolitor]